MPSPTATKRIAAIASVLALAAACSGETPATPVDAGGGPDVTTNPPALTARGVNPVITNQLDLRTDMRQIWTDHAVWMRNYIIDAVAATPDAPLTLQHTLLSQSHIGEAFKPFYGKAAAAQLTTLWNTHVADAAEVVGAVKSGNPDAVLRGKLAWYSNADQIAAYMAQLNPGWSLTDLKTRMRRQVDLTFGEITARVSGNWAVDVVGFDLLEADILGFSDFVTTGIATQFRPAIPGSPLSPRDEELSVTMRKLAEENAAWTRYYIVGRTAHLPDTAFAEERLLRNQVDIGDAFKPWYGAAAGNQLTALLRDQVAKETALFAALESSDEAAIAAARAALYASADAVAQFLVSKNPYWTFADLQDRTHHLLDLSAQEVSARIAQNWQWDIIFYDAVIIDILPFADLVQQGITQQFPQVPLAAR